MYLERPGCERLHPTSNLLGDIAVAAAGPPRDHVLRKAAGLVKIRTGYPGIKRERCTREAGARGGVTGIREKIDDIRPRDLTQFFRHPLSTKFISEIKALRDRARAPARSVHSPFIPSCETRPFALCGRPLWEWTIEPRDRTAPT